MAERYKAGGTRSGDDGRKASQIARGDVSTGAHDWPRQVIAERMRSFCLNGSHVAVVLLSLGVCLVPGLPLPSTHPVLCGFTVRRSCNSGFVAQNELSSAEKMRPSSTHCPTPWISSVIAVEAGLGLDQALMRVGDEISVAHPALADELRLRNLEVNMGRSRADALRNLADRTGVEDLKALVAILIQTDKFGTSVGQALRTFSDSLRIKRRQRAEEQAAKLAIKMVVPMVLFIFPGVFIVVLGPAFIAIVRDLLPTLAGN